MDFQRFEWFWDQNVGHPVASCGILCRPVVACRTGLDAPNIKISDSGGLVPEGWKDWNGLEEVTEGLEGMGGRDEKKFSHARASGARRILYPREIEGFPHLFV